MIIEGRSVLVTGAARRVGRAIALAFASEGADIVAHCHRATAEARSLAAEVEALGRRCRLVRADLADAAAVGRMIQELSDERIDVLVNSASVFRAAPLAELTAGHWEENMAVNLRAPFLLSRALGLAMAKRGEGKIVNIADTGVRRPYANHLPYLVSKSGLVALTELLALELAPAVQVNTVAPGTVLLPENATKGLEEAISRRTLVGRIGQPYDVARMVLYLVRDGDFLTGGYYAVDGGTAIR